MDTLQSKYTIKLDWKGKHFLGLKLDWNYQAGHVNFSIPDYIPTALHRLKHPTKFPPLYATSNFIAHIYGKISNTQKKKIISQYSSHKT